MSKNKWHPTSRSLFGFCPPVHFAAIFVSVVFRENRGVINARRAKEKSDLSCMSVMQDSPDMVDERLWNACPLVRTDLFLQYTQPLPVSDRRMNIYIPAWQNNIDRYITAN